MSDFGEQRAWVFLRWYAAFCWPPNRSPKEGLKGQSVEGDLAGSSSAIPGVWENSSSREFIWEVGVIRSQLPGTQSPRLLSAGGLPIHMAHSVAWINECKGPVVTADPPQANRTSFIRRGHLPTLLEKSIWLIHDSELLTREDAPMPTRQIIKANLSGKQACDNCVGTQLEENSKALTVYRFQLQ